MQQIKKKLYAAPRVKSVKFQVERGFESSPDLPPTEIGCSFTSNNYLEDWVDGSTNEHFTYSFTE